MFLVVVDNSLWFFVVLCSSLWFTVVLGGSWCFMLVLVGPACSCSCRGPSLGVMELLQEDDLHRPIQSKLVLNEEKVGVFFSACDHLSFLMAVIRMPFFFSTVDRDLKKSVEQEDLLVSKLG